MTTSTLERQARDTEKQRPLWQSMLRVTWIQHRVSLIVMVGIFGLVGVLMIVTGTSVHGDYTKYLSDKCSNFGNSPFNRNECSALGTQILQSQNILTVIDIVMHVIPLVIGMFIGAPLVAREFESGTYQFAWTQGTPRSSWVAMKLLFLGVIVVVLAIPLGLIASWWAQPANAIGFVSHWQSGQFGATAMTFPVICLTGLLAGVLMGAFLKKVVSAIAITGLVVGGLVLGIFAYLDNAIFSIHTSATTWYPSDGNIGLINRFNQAGFGPKATWGGWLVDIWYQGANGVHFGTAQGIKIMNRLFANYANKTQVEPPRAELAWLASHHYSFWISYQSANRFWIAQSGEAVLVLAFGFIFFKVTMKVIEKFD